MDSDSPLKIDILFGLDYFWKFVKPNVCSITEYPSAQETKFGWIISGSWEKGAKGGDHNHIGQQLLCMTDIPDQLCHKLWDLDAIGISDDVHNVFDSDAKVVDHFNETCQFDGELYVVQLPWLDGQREKLVDNLMIAKKRSANLTKRLHSNPSLCTAYNAVLSEMETSGIIHEVSPPEIKTRNPTFYLPHRPVVRENSVTTKIRPVFDGSMKGPNGISLNDCMSKGPNLIPNLIEIMLRFRRWKFGLTSDITKAFLQIKVNKVDHTHRHTTIYVT